MKIIDVDVIIAGGGPAGSSLATRLGRAGFSVALLEAKRMPRHKPCGEFMSPECLPMLEDLGVGSAVSDLGARWIRGMRLFGYGCVARGRYRSIGQARAPFDHGYAVRRERFDLVLLERAKAEPTVRVLERHRVTGLLRDRDGSVRGVEVATPGKEPFELRASFTIGADGFRSRVARSLGVQKSVPWLRKFALVTRFSGVTLDDSAEVHFFPGGYFALSGVDNDLLSVNLVIDEDVLATKQGSWDDFLRQYLERAPLLRARLENASRVDPIRGIGPLARKTRRQTFDGAALVGDACGYVDPVTGEGIYFALRGAQMLADTLASALHARRRDRRALHGYVCGRRRELAPRALLGLCLQRGLRHPGLARRVLSVLQARPALTDLLVALAGDYVPLRELRRPSVWCRALSRV